MFPRALILVAGALLMGALLAVPSLVAAEASQINRLDRLLNRYGDEQVSERRLNLLAYTKSIADDEWPTMLRGNRSDKVRRAFAPLLRESSRSSPRPGRKTTIYGEILRSFDMIAESR